jgi:hypothetical protein
MNKKFSNIEDRFWSKVDQTNPSGCWIWLACVRGSNSYGVFRISKDKGDVQAHRYSYELKFGPIPKGMLICHKCDNPKCVNPDHLFLGTHKTNAMDRELKNRSKTHGQQKLTLDQVIQIKSSSLSQSKLSKIYHVSRKTIASIQYGQTWKNITTDSNCTNIVCKICGRTAIKSLFIDINYQYRNISDDLCMACQKGLTSFNHNAQLLESAALYIKQNN